MYVAEVNGKVEEDVKVVNVPIRPDPLNKPKQVHNNVFNVTYLSVCITIQ